MGSHSLLYIYGQGEGCFVCQKEEDTTSKKKVLAARRSRGRRGARGALSVTEERRGAFDGGRCAGVPCLLLCACVCVTGGLVRAGRLASLPQGCAFPLLEGERE